MAKGDFAKAVEDYSGAMWLNPEVHGYWGKRARAYLLLGENDKAAADLTHLAGDIDAQNDLAWQLATDAIPSRRKPRIAVELAQKVLAAAPDRANIWNTLGVARYRAGDYEKAIEALQKSRAINNGDFSWDAFFLAMAHWQLGHKNEARKWYAQAVDWMDKHAPQNDELLRFRAESARLMGISISTSNPSTQKTG